MIEKCDCYVCLKETEAKFVLQENNNKENSFALCQNCFKRLISHVKGIRNDNSLNIIENNP